MTFHTATEDSAPTGIREDLDLTLFVPCFNEEAHIAATLETVQATMAQLPYSYEVIVVDDGSTDRTAAVVGEFCRNHPEQPIRLHRNGRNLGLARSFVDTAFRGRGHYYRLICGDNIESRESMTAILSLLGKADIIVPYFPVVTGKSRARLLLSRTFTTLVNLASGYRLHYYNGHPLYRRYDVMRWASENAGFGFQADQLTKLIDAGRTFLEIPVPASHRGKGRGASALNLRNLLSVLHGLLAIVLRRFRRFFFGSPMAPALKSAPRKIEDGARGGHSGIASPTAARSTCSPAPPANDNLMSTREPQYQRSLELLRQDGLASLGLMTNQAWRDDPRHLVFTLSRYKFAAKMLAGRSHVLEVGCGDAFGTRIVVQSVKQLTAVDFDPVFVEDVHRRMDARWRFACFQHDMLAGPVPGGFDAVYALDVLEHIDPAQELAFLGNMVGSLVPHGVLLLGTPSLQSQVHAGPASKAGHINCKDSDSLKALLERFFHNVFVFSMNDEVVHTGYYPMAHYLLGLACTRKKV